MVFFVIINEVVVVDGVHRVVIVAVVVFVGVHCVVVDGIPGLVFCCR